MIRGIEKRPIVDDDTDRKEFVLRMGDLATEKNTPLYARTVLTNHAHMLLRSGPRGLSNFMRRFLTRYAVYYNRG
jgi:hypothetical protein